MKKKKNVLALLHSGKDCERNGDLIGAERHWRRALELAPDNADAWHLLGVLFWRAKSYDEALTWISRAIELVPDHADFHANITSVLNDLGRFDEAIAAGRRALKLQPDHAVALNNLANALAALGHVDEATDLLKRSVALGYAPAASNLGTLLAKRGRFTEALDYLKQAVAASPGSSAALHNLAVQYGALGRVRDAADTLRRALSLDPRSAETHSSLIFFLDFDPQADVRTQQQERRLWWQKQVIGRPQTSTGIPHKKTFDPERKLCIGYISADFRAHSAALTFAPMLRHFDRSWFDVICYSNGRINDGVTEELKSRVTGWRDIAGVDDESVCRWIHEDGIDILVDLSAHSEGNRLMVFARQPAPIQITAWGHANGTGMSEMGVLLTDPVTIEPSQRVFYAEELVDLPCTLTYELPPHETLPPVTPPPMITCGKVTFGCFNRLAKMGAEALDLWCEILHAVPGSRMLLKAPDLDDPLAQSRLIDHFASSGIDPGRIELVGRTGHIAHLAAHGRVDICLDPVPHGGGISTFEALWMGVPVICLLGTTHVSRLTAGILTAVSMADWVARSKPDYVRLAIEAASRPEALGNLRQRLRDQLLESDAGNPLKYVRTVEECYRSLWRRACRRKRGEFKDELHALNACAAQALDLHRAGRHAEAAAEYMKLLDRHPNHPDLLQLLGVIALQTGHTTEAIDLIGAALARNPGVADWHSNLGHAWRALGDPRRATACALRAAELKEKAQRRDDQKKGYEAAVAQRAAGDIKGALLSFQKLLDRDPGFADAHHGMVTLLEGDARPSAVIEQLRQVLRQHPRAQQLHSVIAYSTDFDPTLTTAQQQQERKNWYQQQIVPKHIAPLALNVDRDPNRKLRIGFIPGRYYFNPSVCTYLPVLQRLDRLNFEVYCYDNFPSADNITLALQRDVDGWCDITSLTDEEVALRIRDDRIDILVDLFAHAGANRLPIYEYKPAPVQVTAWGHANGTGMATMDYLFSDPVSIPPEETGHYAETVHYLPCQLSYWMPEQAPPVSPLPATREGHGERGVVFGCFNRMIKVSDPVVALWSDLLRAIPMSRLLLKSPEFALVEQRILILDRFSACGIAPERITLHPGSPWFEHLERYGEVDIALDPFPMGGGVTTLDALWMGVPVVCLKGGTLGQRITSAIMTAIGLEDWVTESREAYLGIAIAKAQALPELAHLRATLRQRMADSPLAPDHYVKHVERAFRAFWLKFLQSAS